MLAAITLGGNGRYRSEARTLFTISGSVTDEYGDPIADAFIGISDNHGHFYLFECDNSGNFEIRYNSTMIGNQISTSKSGYWYQCRTINITEGKDEFVNFTLTKSPITAISDQPIVLATVLPGSTFVEVSTKIDSENTYLLMDSYSTGSQYPFWIPETSFYNVSDDQSLFSYRTCMCTIIGECSNVQTANRSIMVVPYVNGTVDETNMTLNRDYLSADNVVNDYEIYTLEQGQNLTIKTIPTGEHELPKAFWLESIANVLGTNVTFERMLGFKALQDSTTYASVTLTALTPGTHTYKVFIEDSYIIHVWEM